MKILLSIWRRLKYIFILLSVYTGYLLFLLAFPDLAKYIISIDSNSESVRWAIARMPVALLAIVSAWFLYFVFKYKVALFSLWTSPNHDDKNQPNERRDKPLP